MKIFKNKELGIIEKVKNEMVIEQYEKRPEIYEEIKENKEPTLNELKAKAKEMGIEYDNKVKKDELLALISAKENN